MAKIKTAGNLIAKGFRWGWKGIFRATGIVRQIACGMHIYDTFQESLIKTLLFLIAFLVSVLPLFIGYANNNTTAGDSQLSDSDIVATETHGLQSDLEDSEADAGVAEQDSYIAAGGALIVYGISLIAEICMLLTPNDFFPKKILKGTILLIGVIMMAFGFVQVFIPPLAVTPSMVTTVGSLSVLIYVFDTVVFYLVKPSSKYLRDGSKAKIKDIFVGA